MKVAVLGAGAWGTALAIAAAAQHDTVLWAREDAQAAAMRRCRCNWRYLPDVRLPDAMMVVGGDSGHQQALAHALADPGGGLTVIATPMSSLRDQLLALTDNRGVLWLCKGFEAGSGALGHEIAREVRPDAAAGVLSGPSFAQEVARGQPTALVAASIDAALTEAAVAAFHGESLRVYTSTDVVGVEVGGAVKNVLAIATGILDGLPATGINARAALITRGLAEMSRLGTALGAQPHTFMGLSGLGDLVLTATGDLSRNRRVGLMLAGGAPLATVLQSLGHVAEGVWSAPTMLARARALGVEMPIAEAVAAVLDGSLTPADAMRELMARDARAES
ncbi:MAG: NAD(P)H-dependent glycerol-3-phosphate dehydrogenase [Rubrivivax sp.]